MKKKLTDEDVEAYEGDHRDYPVLWDSIVPGLGVRRSKKTGEKVFIYQRRVKGTGQERTIKIGRVGEEGSKLDKRGKRIKLHVERARTAAIRYKEQMEGNDVLGIDPIDPVAEKQKRLAEKRRQEEEERAAAKLKEGQDTTLREVLEDFLEHRKLRPATIADYRHHVEVNLKDWADRPVTTISRDMCVAKFKEMTYGTKDRKPAPGQANSMLVYLRSLLNHGRSMHEDDDGMPRILAANQASRAIKHMKGLNDEEPRKTRIPTARVGHVWNALRERAKNPRTRTAADWISIVLLTGARKTESGSLSWSNVNFDEGTIRFPGEVTKNHRELVLPMSEKMREILKAREGCHEVYVFPSRTGKTYTTDPREALDAVSEAAGCKVTLHDFRRTFEDICIACKIDSDVKRVLINHKTGDVHSRHYSNADGAALQAPVDAIAAWVTTQAEIAAGRNVVPMVPAAKREAG